MPFRFTPQVKRLENPDYARLRLSLALCKEGLFDTALEELLIVLPRQRKSVYVHLALGNLYMLQKRYVEALYHYEELCDIDPLLAVGPTKLGNVYLKQGYTDKAQTQFELSLRLDPKYTAAYAGLGLVQTRVKDYDGAIAYFQKALELAPDSALTYVSLAKTYKEQKQLKLAKAHIDRALEIKPDLLQALTQRGWICLDQKNYKEAEASFRQALECNERSIDARIGIAEVCVATVRLKEAIKMAEEITAVSNAETNPFQRSYQEMFDSSAKTWRDRINERSHEDIYLYYLSLGEQETYLTSNVE